MRPFAAVRAVLPALPLVALVVAAAAVPAQAKFQPSRRTHAPELKPPVAQAGSLIEGWAEVCVTVGVDGKASAARVIDAGPDDAFAEPGRKAAEGWRFDPARLDGAPTEEFDVCDFQLFTLAVAPSEATTEKLREAQRLFDDDRADEAAAVLEDLGRTGPLTLRQGAERDLLRSRVAAKQGRPEESSRALEHATIDDGRFLPEDVRVDALSARFAFLVGQRRYHEALELFDRFETLLGGAKPMVIHGKTAADIRDLVQGDTSFTVPARLAPALGAEGGAWRHRPLRRELGARKLEGELSALIVVCDVRTMRLTYQEDVSWRIPDSWGECSLYAEGKPGTTFELIEYAKSSESEDDPS